MDRGVIDSLHSMLLFRQHLLSFEHFGAAEQEVNIDILGDSKS